MSEIADQETNVGFPIVGIVASAGGLGAFKKFFSAMPADSGVALVLIPHLDPSHESLMAGLLSKLTPMPVIEAQQGMPVEVNNVYIIPPNKFLAISDGQLQLSVPPHQHGWRTSIDFFLRSLAQDQSERAIGIVLSGTGSHGALGVREIKLAGGMTMAQQPDTAEYNQMPQSAIATGQIDCVLPPEKMPAALLDYVEQPYLSNAGKTAPPSAESTDLLNQVLTVLQSRTKYDFRSYRKAMVLRRIERRMSLAHVDSMAHYLELLHKRPEEATALYKDLLISVTAFFRDPEAYRVLEQEVIPALIARHNGDLPIRVWVPGCATGEEAYSIAMLLLEGISSHPSRSPDGPAATGEKETTASGEAEDGGGKGERHHRKDGKPEAGTEVRVQVFASDIDDDAIEFARVGVFPASIVSDVSPERLKRFFTLVDDSHYRINKQLRESIVFSHQNLIGDAPFSKLDLISCRNLLIYLEPELQQKVIALLHFSLVIDGYMLLGPSETISGMNDLFETISKKWRVYRRIGPSRRDLIGIPLVIADERRNVRPRGVRPGLRRSGLKELAEQLVLDEFAPASVLINRKYEILYLTGPLVNYLKFPMGELTKDLLAMTRPGLRTQLCITCNDAIRDGRLVVETAARVKRDGRYVHCVITVRPLTEPKEAEGLMLVTFQDRDPWQTIDSDGVAVAGSSTADSFIGEDSPLVRQLEFELRSLSEELHSTIEEMEGSTEELKTSNEEIMSVNEELQSANEELETSKEELQSLNEELETVNCQLKNKVTELDETKDDLINLMSSTEIATLFIDNDFIIKRFTPPTTALLNLRFTDIGRPLRDIAPRFPPDEMLNECQLVLNSLTPIEQEIRTEDGRYYLRRALPYRTIDHHLGGVVITFVDLTQRKHAEEIKRQADAEFVAALHESTERMAAILDTAADAIFTIDKEGRIDTINRATESLFGYERTELIGEHVSLLIPAIDGNQKHFSLDDFVEHQQAQSMGNVRESVARRKNGSTFPIDLVIGRVDHLGLFTGILRDISERRKLQAHILEIATDEQRRIGQELHDGTQQELTGLTLFAGALCELLDTSVRSGTESSRDRVVENEIFEKLTQIADRLLSGLKKANQNVHKLSHGIMPVQIDAEGLRSALAELATTTNELEQVSCFFESSGASSIPNNLIATQLYRIAQESLGNALQHGQASEVRISLSQQDKQIALEVRDNGIGIDPQTRHENVAAGRGMGLRIMEYRTSLLGGILQIDRNNGPGMTIRCVIPITDAMQ
ncbi:MAG: PAS domain S-box protein [Planctomycetaceae bacterium]|nr:MAG: PAS domain S-box protein [Planctomycetaceae bacterium]